jgi:hypothetical protein
MRSKVGSTATRALREMTEAHRYARSEGLTLVMTGVGVVDWESGHAMTIYPEGLDGRLRWYYHDHQAEDVAYDYRNRAQIRRVTYYPSGEYILTDRMC